MCTCFNNNRFQRCSMICIFVLNNYIISFTNIQIFWYCSYVFVYLILQSSNEYFSKTRFFFIVYWMHFYIVVMWLWLRSSIHYLIWPYFVWFASFRLRHYLKSFSSCNTFFVTKRINPSTFTTNINNILQISNFFVIFTNQLDISWSCAYQSRAMV